jgi:hypothetical protein
MKPLRNLNNVERAKLLFELFPDEMPQFLAVMEEITQKVLKDPDQLRTKWEGQLITVEFWFQLIKKSIEINDKYGKKLSKNSKLFSDQLFDGYQALYSSHCLHQYRKICPNQALAKVIDAFFNYN